MCLCVRREQTEIREREREKQTDKDKDRKTESKWTEWGNTESTSHKLQLS